jgi:putative ABC transport system permease protein
MIYHYLLVAFRNLWRKKVFAGINAVGLAVGLTCCLLLGLYIEHHLSYDRFHEKRDRIYRVHTVQSEIEGGSRISASGSILLGPALEDDFPAVERAVRVTQEPATFATGGRETKPSVLFADPAFFDVFTFPTEGETGGHVLSRPDGLVLSRSAAENLFGTEDAIGREVVISFREEDEETLTFRVGAILDDVPAASSFQFDAVMPFEYATRRLPESMRGFAASWALPLTNTFVVIRSGADADQVTSGLPGFIATRVPEAHAPSALELMPLTEIHLAAHVQNALAPPGNRIYMRILGGIALLVLLIGCINFVTLNLGVSVSRAREVGVRKSLGAYRRQLAGQYWGEAFLLTTAALVMAAGLTSLALPIFSNLVETPLAGEFVFRPEHLAYLAILGGGVALMAGAYPALFLSGQPATRVLKGRVDLRGQDSVMKPLVVAQFAISIGLVVMGLGMSSQLRFMSNYDLGLPDGDLLVVDLGGSAEGERAYEALRQELEAAPEIADVTGAFFSFGEAGLEVALTGRDGEPVQVHLNPVDDNFVRVMGLQLMAGADLFETVAERGVLVNETLVERLGWSDPVGMALPLHEGPGFGRVLQGAVVQGVVRDYHVAALHREIPPLVLVRRNLMGGGVMAAMIRIEADDRAAGLERVRETWTRVAPGRSFSYTFLGDAVEAAYRTEARSQAMMHYAAIIAVLIACLGLFGLATLAAERRRKEVGVRRVLGATTAGIIALLSKDFVGLVAVGFVLATPIAYVTMIRWLEGFAYRIDVGPGLFLGAGALALVVALATVSLRAWAVAVADPVKSLRSEI